MSLDYQLNSLLLPVLQLYPSHLHVPAKFLSHRQTSIQWFKLILVVVHCVRAECILDVHGEKGFNLDNGVKNAGWAVSVF